MSKSINELKAKFKSTYKPSDSYQRSRQFLLDERELRMEDKLQGFAEIDSEDDSRRWQMESQYIQDNLVLDEISIVITGEAKAQFNDEWQKFFAQAKQAVQGKTWTQAKSSLPIRSLSLYGETYGTWVWTRPDGAEITTEIHAGKVTKIGLDGWQIVDMSRW